MSKITLFQTERNWNLIKDEWLALVSEHHGNGSAQGGDLCLRLESELCRRFNRKFCITTASCTDALVLSIMSLNLPLGSYIAVSNYTFTASAHAIERAGHVPVPVDVTRDYCIDVSKIPTKVSAIVAVDLFGNMCDWEKLAKLNVPVIADSAQSFESRDVTGWSGSKGTTSCLSFSPSKTMSSWGSGGAILTDSPVIASQCRKLRLHGKSKNNDLAISSGLNSMMSTSELAAVLVSMTHADLWTKRRQKIADYLVDIAQYECATDFTLPINSLHKLVFKDESPQRISEKLKSANIAYAIHYENLINDEPLYKTNEPMLVSDELKRMSLTVPNQHSLTDDEVERIGKELS